MQMITISQSVTPAHTYAAYVFIFLQKSKEREREKQWSEVEMHSRTADGIRYMVYNFAIIASNDVRFRCEQNYPGVMAAQMYTIETDLG